MKATIEGIEVEMSVDEFTEYLSKGRELPMMSFNEEFELLCKLRHFVVVDTILNNSIEVTLRGDTH